MDLDTEAHLCRQDHQREGVNFVREIRTEKEVTDEKDPPGRRNGTGGEFYPRNDRDSPWKERSGEEKRTSRNFEGQPNMAGFELKGDEGEEAAACSPATRSTGAVKRMPVREERGLNEWGSDRFLPAARTDYE
ncbi:hypothetical protein J437_LFUL008046 [Ladona fulva]|uniref:Uncharacterized protein n=1 Tax=Ladona fulva TaxID=123851 RepID=A0A8K0P7P4_LADFU|nr:hypothetical protein J437_LFUL008046 [Ladona fulva]